MNLAQSSSPAGRARAAAQRMGDAARPEETAAAASGGFVKGPVGQSGEDAGRYDAAEIAGGDALDKLAYYHDLFARYARENRDLRERMQRAQDELKEELSRFDWLYKEPRAVPSTVGQTLDHATRRLGRSELQVGGVRQQYSDKVARGCIISQVPGPGARLNKNAAVRVVISKGPPPDREKYTRLRKQEQVRSLRFQSRFEPDKVGRTIPTPDLAAACGEPAIEP